MTHSLHRLSQALLAAFLIVAAATGYWALLRQDELVAREDNPRLVLQEQLIQRGEIIDRNGAVIAATIPDASGLLIRTYPYPAAAPIVGYYSLRHGVGGIEAVYDSVLRGVADMSRAEQILQDVLHRPQVGGDVRLTIDALLQQEAAHILGDHRGAIVLVSVPQGEILAMVGEPTFNPNTLADNWDALSNDPHAPLLNRATQGLYQPGTILQSVVLGAALDTGTSIPPSAWGRTLDAPVDDGILPCAGLPRTTIDSVEKAFVWACPGPFQPLGTAIGARSLNAILTSFGLFEPPVFPLPTSSAGMAPSDLDDVSLTGIGQSALTVTPLQMVQVAAAFANHGEIPALRLVQAVRMPGEPWAPVHPDGYARGTISRASADRIAALMGDSVQIGAAQEAAIPNGTVRGHVGLALAGPEGTLNAWFIGFVGRPNGQAIAVAVLLEDETDAALAARIGGEVLQLSLEHLP